MKVRTITLTLHRDDEETDEQFAKWGNDYITFVYYCAAKTMEKNSEVGVQVTLNFSGDPSDMDTITIQFLNHENDSDHPNIKKAALDFNSFIAARDYLDKDTGYLCRATKAN